MAAVVVHKDGGRAATLARAVAELAGEVVRHQAARGAIRPGKALASVLGRRHPLSPAAIRVERSHVRDDHGRGDQTALTVWFGEAPALPGPAVSPVSGLSARTVLGAALGLTGMVALGALGVIANQRETRRPVEARTVPRLDG